MKDLLQNHLVQILCTTTMEQGGGAEPGERRLAALRAVRVPTATQAATVSRRARYTGGRLAATGGGHGQRVPDYSAEDGVDPARNTETYAEVSLTVAAPQWSGTRFVLRAGKAMSRRRRGVLIRFGNDPATNEPTGPDLWIDVDRPSDKSTGPVEGAHRSAPLEQLAYVNVLRNVLSGGTELSVSAAETELAWRLCTPVLTSWAEGAVPLGYYRAGTSPDPSSCRPTNPPNRSSKR